MFFSGINNCYYSTRHSYLCIHLLTFPNISSDLPYTFQKFHLFQVAYHNRSSNNHLFLPPQSLLQELLSFFFKFYFIFKLYITVCLSSYSKTDTLSLGLSSWVMSFLHSRLLFTAFVCHGTFFLDLISLV